MDFVTKSRLVLDQTWFLSAKRTSLLRMLLLITDCVNYLAFNWSVFVLKYSIWPNVKKKKTSWYFWWTSYQILIKVLLISASFGMLQRAPESLPWCVGFACGGDLVGIFPFELALIIHSASSPMGYWLGFSPFGLTGHWLGVFPFWG